ncbi:MAG: hypothetical protein EOP04_27600, partial [Proteobacteria bacterium]
MKFRFDHLYTMDKNFVFRKKLKKAGFHLNDYFVEHPGKAFCRFVYIPTPAKAGRIKYLEFIHIGKGGEHRGIAGISFSSLTSLDQVAEDKKMKKLGLEFTHKNYAWKENSQERLPGWNFIRFPKHKSKIYTWLTEYEMFGIKKLKKRPEIVHANKVSRLVSIECDFSPKDEALYESLLGRPQNSQFHFECGTPLNFKRASKSQVKSVIFATSDLKSMIKKIEWDELTVYDALGWFATYPVVFGNNSLDDKKMEG